MTIEGRERFPVRVRYVRAVPRDDGEHRPHTDRDVRRDDRSRSSQVANIRTVNGASMIASENGLLKGTVLLNVQRRDVGSFVAEADARGEGESRAAGGILHVVERIVRKPAACETASAARRSDRRYRNLRPSVSDIRFCARGRVT